MASYRDLRLLLLYILGFLSSTIPPIPSPRLCRFLMGSRLDSDSQVLGVLPKGLSAQLQDHGPSNRDIVSQDTIRSLGAGKGDIDEAA